LSSPGIIKHANYSAPDRERNIVMSVSVFLCVCLSAITSSKLHVYVRSSPIFLCTLPMAVARCSSVLPVLWMTSCLIVSHGCSTSPPAEAQRTRSLGLGNKLCAVIPFAGQRTHGTTFPSLKVTSQVATPGAESAVYNCLVIGSFVHFNRRRSSPLLVYIQKETFWKC